MNQTLTNFKKGDVPLHDAARAWLLKEKAPPGIQQWIDFHINPLFHMHFERWGNTAQTLRTLILNSFYAKTYVEEYFDAHGNGKANVWTELKNPLIRLAISDYRFLKNLAAFAGALVSNEKIRKTIDRKSVQLLRKELGEEIFHFAHTQVQYSDLVPEKFRSKSSWIPSQGSVGMLNAGWILIACAAALLPTGEWRQFLNRLPQSIEEEWKQYDFSVEDFRMAWKCLQKVIEITRGAK